MLFDMIKEVEQKASVTSPAPEPRRLEAEDREVLQNLVERIRQQILSEMAAESIEAPGAEETRSSISSRPPTASAFGEKAVTDNQCSHPFR